ncbi:MAG: HTH-type transcriptional regulator GalS [Lentisphaerae bacterium ADurb.Bin242]|nr:MAG: HTH-type transcriptional regulator GalS [Lentisphaerae bacterium ADurb.Bin242]
MITQKTIAEKLGISTSLVSRALSGTASNIGASEETVRRIRETAAELGYVPNPAALTLRGFTAKVVGVIIKDFNDPFLGRMTEVIQERAHKNGCSLNLTGFDAVQGIPRDSASLLRYRLDALIICGSDICSDWVEEFTSRDIPVAQVGVDNDFPGVVRVEVDEAAGIRMLVEYVLLKGHRQLGFIGGSSGPHLRRRRLLEEVLCAKNIASEFVSVPEDGNSGIRAMEKLLQKTRKCRPTAVLAADDFTAQGGLRALYENGLSVPRDISLTGFDDIPSAELMIPALTTIRVPVRRMVAAAFDLIAEAGTKSRKVRKLAPELIERESCIEYAEVNSISTNEGE